MKNSFDLKRFRHITQVPINKFGYFLVLSFKNDLLQIITPCNKIGLMEISLNLRFLYLFQVYRIVKVI